MREGVFLKPKGFYPAGKGIKRVWLVAERPGFIKQRRVDGARAKGLRYEAKAQGHLKECFGERFVAGQWLGFVDGRGKKRFCQADGVIVGRDTIVVVEIKLNHTPTAWWQLRTLYEPVLGAYLRQIGSKQQVRGCEVVKWYDPACHFPEPVRLLRTPEYPPSSEMGVYIWGDRKG